MAGAEAAATSAKGYYVYSWAKTGQGLYVKSTAQGLNNLKGVWVTTTGTAKFMKFGGPIVATALEVPEIIEGYEKNTQEGNKQIACTVGGVGGVTLGGMGMGALLGASQVELGPFVIIPIAIGAGVGAYYGEEAVEAMFDQLVNPTENSRSKQIETLKYNPYLILGPKY
jgi:hypothetical protein